MPRIFSPRLTASECIAVDLDSIMHDFNILCIQRTTLDKVIFFNDCCWDLRDELFSLPAELSNTITPYNNHINRASFQATDIHMTGEINEGRERRYNPNANADEEFISNSKRKFLYDGIYSVPGKQSNVENFHNTVAANIFSPSSVAGIYKIDYGENAIDVNNLSNSHNHNNNTLIQARYQKIDEAQLNHFQSILEATTQPHTIVISKYNVDMTYYKISCLAPDIWLNDEVINFYMNMLQDRDMQLCNLFPDRSSNQFFNSHFVERLLFTDKTYKYKNVRKWTKNVDVFQKDKLFFPVNVLNSHWTLLVIMIGEKQIHYYDSINGRGLHFLDGMLQWIIDEASDKKGLKVNPSEWSLVSQEGYVPQQENGVDCGMFTIMMTDMLSDKLPLTFNQNHIPTLRNKVATDIIRGELMYPLLYVPNNQADNNSG